MNFVAQSLLLISFSYLWDFVEPWWLKKSIHTHSVLRSPTLGHDEVHHLLVFSLGGGLRVILVFDSKTWSSNGGSQLIGRHIASE